LHAALAELAFAGGAAILAKARTGEEAIIVEQAQLPGALAGADRVQTARSLKLTGVKRAYIGAGGGAQLRELFGRQGRVALSVWALGLLDFPGRVVARPAAGGCKHTERQDGA
jgi:hypothetical protein